MTQTQYNMALAEVVAKYPRSSGDNLRGMIEDFAHSLSESSLLTRVDVRKTGDPERMIEARCRRVAQEATTEDIAHELEQLWLQWLRYRSGEEAHTLVITDQSVHLSAVTVSGLNGYYVSSSVIVSLDRSD